MSDEQPNRGERRTPRQDDGDRTAREDREAQRDRRSARQDGEDRHRRPEQQHDGDRPRRAPRQEGDRPQPANRDEGDRPRRATHEDGDRQRPQNQNDDDRPRRAPRQEGDRPRQPSRDDVDRRQSQDDVDGDRQQQSSRGDGAPSRERGERPFDAVAASRIALDALQTMTNRTAEGVIGVERDDDGGWIVVVELLETARIPTTADVLGEYEVDIAPDRTLRSYTRRARYTRASTMSDS